MKLMEWIQQLIEELINTPLLHWVGVLCGVVQVLLAKSNKVLLYPFGIASILITLFVLYEAGLYAEQMLNLYYLVMSIYGWAHWARNKNEPSLPVTYANRKGWWVFVVIIGVGCVGLSMVLIRFSGSSEPIWFAWVSATSWAGMWLLANRKIEIWVLLNICNAFAIPFLAYKGLLLYALLPL